jgi:uncharacterized RDD family membrane protein YckC
VATSCVLAKRRCISLSAKEIGGDLAPESNGDFQRVMTARIESRQVAQVRSAASSRAVAEEHAPIRSAPFALRCGALLIDYILLIAVIAFSTILARMSAGGAKVATNSSEKLGLYAAIALAVLNFVVLGALTGQTVGKWATGLRVVRRNGRRIGWTASVIRHLPGYLLSILTLGLGFMLALVTPSGRALHDYIAGTAVVVDERKRSRLRA